MGVDQHSMATAGGREVKLWDLRFMEMPLATSEPHSKTISKLSYLGSQSRLLSVAQDGMLRVLKPEADYI